MNYKEIKLNWHCRGWINRFICLFCSGLDFSHRPSGHSAGADDAEAVDEFGVVCSDFVFNQYHRRILGRPFAH